LKAARFSKKVLVAIRGKTKDDRQAVGAAIRDAQQHFGDPHSHRGSGIRKVTPIYYELRVGLDCRLLFTNEPAFLRFVAMGSHDQVKRFLKQQS
jgi:mRNA-degrading endonuclease YafQ of YafQ-DinJ toxin-antitoxin module